MFNPKLKARCRATAQVNTGSLGGRTCRLTHPENNMVLVLDAFNVYMSVLTKTVHMYFYIHTYTLICLYDFYKYIYIYIYTYVYI